MEEKKIGLVRVTEIRIRKEQYGTLDKVTLVTDIPDPYFFEGTIHFSFKCADDKTIDFIKTNWPGVPWSYGNHGQA